MKQNFDNIKMELAARGIEAEQVMVTKNGVPCVGFRIVTGTNISPVVYYSQQETIESFLLRINKALTQIPDISVDCLSDRDYLLKNLYVSVQKVGNENHLVKRKIMNFEAFLRIKVIVLRDGEVGSIKVTDALLDMSGISVDEAWNRAISNMVDAFSVRSMAAVLGLSEELFDEPFYVVTTKSGVDGAAALLYPKIFRNFCLEKGIESALILPSSTQEVLIIPEDVDVDYVDFANMVNEINNTEVDPMIQLDPVVYRYDINSDSIQIVAEA